MYDKMNVEKTTIKCFSIRTMNNDNCNMEKTKE